MPAWTQNNKAAQVTTILGTDKLLLESFTATASLSNPFEIIVEALSVDGEVDFTPHLGSGVHVNATLLSNNACDFHGLLFETLRLGPGDGLMRYRLTLRPWFSLLDMNRESRIYQNKSVQNIITEKFTELGYSAYQINIQSSSGTKPREYCVQYRESDFAFLSRLMEEEGIYYYFSHTDSAHTMVLCDGPSCHSLSKPDPVRVERGAPKKTLTPNLWAWEERLRPSVIKTTLRDSNLYTPTSTLDATASATASNPIEQAQVTGTDAQKKATGTEFYDFPGRYAYHDPAGAETGDAYAGIRLQALRRERDVRVGQGNVLTAVVGGRIKMEDTFLYSGEQEADHNKEFLIVSATQAISGQDYAGEGADEEVDVRVDLLGFPADDTWRPLQVTPKPIMGGPQTALVVGDITQEDNGEPEVIEVDQYGRVHVQFYWDRLGEKNQNSSCWLRVSHGSADNGFGHVTLPRIGQEVIVDFLEGDPDRPIVTGRVYNATNLHPYSLPTDKTKSTWKSQTVGVSGSYDGAEEPPTGKGSNEIRYEDKGGSEELYVHAQRVFNAWYRLDETRKTGRDATVRVGRDRVVNVKNNDTYTLEQGDEKHTISTGSLTTTIDQGSETHKLSTGSRTTTIQQNDSLTLTAGDYSMQVSAGQATIEAFNSITLKVGQNSIVINQQGITVQGIQVQITAQAALTAQGLETQVKADTQLTIQGAMVMINS